MEHNKKFDYYFVKCEYKLFSNDQEYCLYITSKLFDSKTMCCWQNFLKFAVDDFENKGHDFNHIEELNIITIAHKLDMSYNFYIRQNMQAVEWKLNAMINRTKKLIKIIIRNWRHSLIRKLIHVLL